MVTQANIPISLTFNKESQVLFSRLNRYKIELLEYKTYFKSQVPLKALQHLFKGNGKQAINFMLEFGRIINKTLSMGLPLPRHKLDKDFLIHNITVASEESYIKLCLNFEEK